MVGLLHLVSNNTENSKPELTKLINEAYFVGVLLKYTSQIGFSFSHVVLYHFYLDKTAFLF